MNTTSRRTNRRLVSSAVLASCLLAAHLTQGVCSGQIPIPLPGGGKSDVTVLREDGPLFPEAYAIGNFSALVLVTGGNLFGVRYRAGDNNTVTIKFVSKDKPEKSFTKTLAPTGGEIKLEMFTLPEDVFGKKPLAVTLSVLAENSAGKPLDFALLNLCTGNGCGSTGIERLSFQPTRLRSALNEKAAYSFYSRFDFNRAYAYFEFAGFTDKGRPANRRVYGQKIDGVRRGETTSREWDGRDQQGKVSKGRHQLFVRAWFTKDGDWTTGWSEQRLSID